MPPPDTVFSLRFFGGFRRQRDALARSGRLAAFPVDPILAGLLAQLGHGEDPAAGSRQSPARIVLTLLRPLLTRTLAIGLLGRLAYIALVSLGAQALTESMSLTRALLVAAGYLALNVLHNGLTFWSDRNRTEVVEGACLLFVARLCAKLRRIDAQRLSAHSAATIKVLIMSDIGEIGEFLSAALWNFVPVSIALIVFGPLIVHHAGVAGLIGIGVALVSVPISMMLSHWMGRQQLKQQRQLDAMTGTASEWLQNLRLSRYLGWQPAFIRELRATLDAYMRPFLRRHTLACLTFGVAFAWWMLPILAMLVAARPLGAEVRLGGIFVAIWLLRDMCEYLQHLPHSFSLLASTRVALGRIGQVMEAVEAGAALAASAATADTPPVAGSRARRILLSSVSLRFDTAAGKPQYALRDVDLSLDLRAKTAIVGLVGSGKTSLLRLLSGELPPSEGNIQVELDDGAREELWTEGVYHAYRSQVAVTPQEPFISNDTVAANVALNEAEHDSAVLAALQAAEFSRDLHLLPRGIAEEIGERGVTLSGGQRQRLALARALFAERGVLFLDDTLSAVDPATEALLVASVRESRGGVVLVSHRLAHLTAFDRVLVLDGGRIVEDGSPSALAARPESRFSELLRAAAAEEQRGPAHG